jgi:gamma-glutamyltranspeptidase/glutathione hydrolase
MPETPVFPAAAVAAPHALAAETGRAVLAEGGNAVEAMVAMAATIAVVYPHMNAIGGDGFWLVREPGGRVRGIEACGPAGSLATRERYRAKGYDAIPPRGPDAALTVAGRWPAGASPSTSPRRSAAACPRKPFSPTPSASPARAPPSRAPRPATSRRRPRRCAPRPAFPKPSSSTARSPRPARSAGCEARDTLAHLAEAGLDDFYRGDVGREIAADFERIGSPVTRRDLEAFAPRPASP